MNALKTETLHALVQVIQDAEDLNDVRITQDLGEEVLVIESESCGFRTIINCCMNSVGATIRQVCKHINKRTLFSYEEGLHNWLLVIYQRQLQKKICFM